VRIPTPERYQILSAKAHAANLQGAQRSPELKLFWKHRLHGGGTKLCGNSGLPQNRNIKQTPQCSTTRLPIGILAFIHRWSGLVHVRTCRNTLDQQRICFLVGGRTRSMSNSRATGFYGGIRHNQNGKQSANREIWDLEKIANIPHFLYP